MKIDSSIREFSERYDREAIRSIDIISKDYALNSAKQTLPTFNMNEAFTNFTEFITGYSKYMIETKDEEKPAKTDEELIEGTIQYISKRLFTEKGKDGEQLRMLYSEIPSFIESYLVGIRSLGELTTRLQSEMLEEGVKTEKIGSIETIMDSFVDRLNESFTPTMNKILWASGYNTRQALKPKKRDSQVSKPIFL